MHRKILGSGRLRLLIDLFFFAGTEREGAICLNSLLELLFRLIKGTGPLVHFLIILVETGDHLGQFRATGIQNGNMHLGGQTSRWQQVAGDGFSIIIEPRQLTAGEPGQPKDKQRQNGESGTQLLANRHVFEHMRASLI